MNTYFAVNCGAIVGGLVGLGVAATIKAVEEQPADIKARKEQEHHADKRAMLCMCVGGVVGGIVGVATLTD